MSTTTTTPTTTTPDLTERLINGYGELSDLRDGIVDSPGRKAFVTRKMILVWDRLTDLGVDPTESGLVHPKGATASALEGASDDLTALLADLG